MARHELLLNGGVYAGERLLGISVGEIVKLQHTNKAAFDSKLDNAKSKQYIFKHKVHTFELDELRARFMAMDASLCT
ncbi:hypothetical protein GGI20_003339 [Coemansia sp. BCRC 34301]|nr:hypothetical protein GGI20_003339 [Coemansia sp. BCRC 34301]